MRQVLAVVLLGGLSTVAGGYTPPSTHPLAVETVQVGRAAHPRQWVGRTVLIKGVTLRAPDTGLLLVDTRVVANLPKGITAEEAADMTLVVSRVESPVPYLVLHAAHAARYGRDERARIYRVRLRSSACPTTGACDDGVLLSVSR